MSLKGSSLVLKKGTSAGGTTIAAARTISLTLNAETVDVTSADDVNRWRKLLPQAGTKQMSVSFSGVLKDVATHNQLVLDWNAQTSDAYGIVIGTLGTWDGNFIITNVEKSGEYNGELQFTVSLESDGEPTYAAVV
jgi:TP901-1 family phage major tail protein